MRHTDPKNARQLEQMCVLALRELFSREQIVRCARQHARPEIIELESGQMFEMTAAGIAVVQCVGEPPNRRGKHERHDRDRQTKNKGHVDRKGKHREAREPKGKGKNREERGGNRRRQKSSS